MKKVVLLLIFALLTVSGLFAQVPQKFNYQAVVRNAAGAIISHQDVGFQFTIRDLTPGGTILYQETHTAPTNDFGLVSLEVGGGTPLSGTFSAIPWGTGNKYLEVAVDTLGGSDFSIIGTPQLLSVPYALYAGGSATGMPAGTANQTIRNNGTAWVADNYVKNTGNSLFVNVDDNVFQTAAKVAIISDSNGLQTAANDSKLALHLINSTQTNGQGPAIGFSNSSEHWTVGAKIAFERTGSFSTGDLCFFTKSSMTSGDMSQERMRITSQGRVGVGTVMPNTAAKLHVVAENNFYAGLFTADSTSSSTNVIRAEYLGGGADAKAVYGVCFPADYNGIGGYFIGGWRGVYGSVSATGTSTYYGVYGNSSSTTAGYNYGVYGTASNTGGTAYAVFASGDMAYTGTITDVSDVKFKKDVNDYTGALQKVMNLRPVIYSMDTEKFPFMGFNNDREIGFIAQELESVIPELVKKGAHPGAEKTDPIVEYKGVNYVGMIPVLTKAIQEQQQLIQQLNDKVNALEQELNALKK